MKKLDLAMAMTVGCVVLWLNVPVCDAACTFAVSKADEGCVENFICDGSHGLTGCSSTTFTVPCTQTYYIGASVTCTGGAACANCLACVNIYNGTTYVANNHNNNCGGPGGGCSASPSAIALSSGITYTLYVCLTQCGNGAWQTCDDCDASCKANGCVYSAGQACPNP